jgi:hypothetical protein
MRKCESFIYGRWAMGSRRTREKQAGQTHMPHLFHIKSSPGKARGVREIKSAEGWGGEEERGALPRKREGRTS